MDLHHINIFCWGFGTGIIFVFLIFLHELFGKLNLKTLKKIWFILKEN
jgi:hypothetical protein